MLVKLVTFSDRMKVNWFAQHWLRRQLCGLTGALAQLEWHCSFQLHIKFKARFWSAEGLYSICIKGISSHHNVTFRVCVCVCMCVSVCACMACNAGECVNVHLSGAEMLGSGCVCIFFPCVYVCLRVGSKNADLHARREQIFICLRAGTLLSYDRLRALMH